MADGSESNWIKMEVGDGQVGWLDMDWTVDPYEDRRGAILETIKTKDRWWTVLKGDYGLAYWETLNVRDKPGITDSTVLFKLFNENNE